MLGWAAHFDGPCQTINFLKKQVFANTTFQQPRVPKHQTSGKGQTFMECLEQFPLFPGFLMAFKSLQKVSQKFHNKGLKKSMERDMVPNNPYMIGGVESNI